MSQFTVISANNSISVELHPDRWRLVQIDAANVGRVLFETAVDDTPTYASEFAQSRRLPQAGFPQGAIEQVVLGWSPRLAAWQLGLVIGGELAAERDSRWCELARWRDPDASLHALGANRAGQALSRVLRVPFKAIPPRIDSADAASSAPAKSLPDLPLDLGQWSLKREGERLAFVRSGAWTRARWGRILWLALWMVAFTALSGLSLTVDLALPNAGTLLPYPEALPVVGFVVALVLALLIIKNVTEVFRTPNRVVVDATARTITAANGNQPHWTLRAPEIEGVYVSEILAARGRKLVSQYGELNLRVGDKAFKHMLTTDEEEELGALNGVKPRAEVAPLTQNDAQSPMAAAAVYVAQALGDVPVWHDRRIS